MSLIIVDAEAQENMHVYNSVAHCNLLCRRPVSSICYIAIYSQM